MNFDEDTSGRLAQPTTFVPPQGDSFSNFEELNSSGYNRLIRAQRYGKYFVLKALASPCKNDPYYQQLLRKEFDLTLSLDHPYLIRVYSLEEVDPYGLCIVMAYVDGRTLNEYLEERPTKNSRRRVVKQMLEALEYCHIQQIVHRDLKPSNVLVTWNGDNVKILDFGLSDANYYAILKEPAFSRRYASPEQLRYEPLDCRTDIYSFGLLLHEIFPRGYRHIVHKCCQPDRNQRYANAGEVIKQFGNPWHTLSQVAAFILLALAAFWAVHAYRHVNISPFDIETPENIHLKCSVVDGKAHIVGGSGVKGHLVIPPTVKHGVRTYAVTGIDSLAFFQELGLTRLTLPEGLKKIGLSAFYGCTNLTDTLVLPMSLECIDGAAFCGAGLTHVILRSRHLMRPDPEQRNMDLFFSCANLKQLIIDTTVEDIDQELLENSFIREVVMLNRWEELPIASLSNIVNVERFIFPPQLKRISSGALWNASAPRVVFPDSLTHVHEFALRFALCRYIEFGTQIHYLGTSSLANLDNLDTLVIRSTLPPKTTPTTFEGTDIEHCMLLVPAKSINRYQRDSIFSHFNIKPL